MKLTFCPLFSGSAGNALLVCGGDTRILIDCGMTGKQITEALLSVGVLPETLSGMVITHEHSDHIKGAGIISRKYRVPIYANEPTWNAMSRNVGEIDRQNRRFFDSDADFMIGDLFIKPFLIPHDAAEPVGFHVHYGNRSVATATDMGHMLKRVYEEIKTADLVLLESNHDPQMLMDNPHYSYTLKQRILGNHGHLCNEICAKTLVKLCEAGVHRAVLGHLSGENNTPQLAMDTAVETLTNAGAVLGDDITVDMSWRDRPGNVYTIE